MDSLGFLTNYVEHFTYLGLFLILFLCGLGLPLSEEIILIFAGFMVFEGVTNLYLTFLVGLTGVITGDLAIFGIGKKWGEGVINHRHLRKVFSERRLEKVRHFFLRHGNKTIFLARFITGFRAATFLAAGTLKMKLGKFLSMDILGSLISVPLFTYLGYLLGSDLVRLGRIISRIDYLIMLSASLIILACLVYRFFKKRR